MNLNYLKFILIQGFMLHRDRTIKDILANREVYFKCPPIHWKKYIVPELANWCAKPAYTNNELIQKKSRNLYLFFSCRWGATHRKIDDPSIYPPIIILDLFRLLVLPYFWREAWTFFQPPL